MTPGIDDPTGVAAWVVLGLSVAALAPAGLRWLRVAQREHYLAGSCTRFAGRWWTSEPVDAGLLAAGVAGVVLSAWWPLTALAGAAVVAVAPRHLSVRGRTSPLVWTRRLRSLAAVWLAVEALVVLAGALAGLPAPLAGGAALLVPAAVDAALGLTAPIERRLSARFVVAAADRLRRVAPTVVAITGSYGKTSTKSHLAHLLAGSTSVLASPASFNNRAGLSRAVNEQLAEGTQVFVAEMGTYGPGEIADLCRWFPPDVAVITAIGPVHLERFGSEERILAAKSEILAGASVAVLNVDDARLAGLADRLGGAATAGDDGGGGGVDPGGGGGPHPVVVRCSAQDRTADVCVERSEDRVAVWVKGRRVGEVPGLGPGSQPTNLACAVAVALHLGLGEGAVLARLGELPAVPNRLSVARAASGVTVLDDTFNSNPAGARAAVAALAGLANAGPPSTGRQLPRRVVVTPGMIELGRRQAAENRAFARAVAETATDLVVVGRTNRRALLAGAGGLRPVTVRTRQQAVEWVRANLGTGDAVLYENDLPDHYP